MRYDLVVFDVHVLGLTSLYPGIAETLQELADLGATLGIVSDAAEADVRGRLGAVQHLIDAYDCGPRVRGIDTKLQRIGRKIAAPHSRMLFVSAEAGGIQVANRLGIASAGAGWDNQKRGELAPSHPTHFVMAPVELVYVLANRPVLRLVP